MKKLLNFIKLWQRVEYVREAGATDWARTSNEQNSMKITVLEALREAKLDEVYAVFNADGLIDIYSVREDADDRCKDVVGGKWKKMFVQ